MYCNYPARGAGRRAVAGGPDPVSRAPGEPVPRRDDPTGVHDAGRRGAAFGAARGRLCAPVTAIPGPAAGCGGAAGSAAGDRDPRPRRAGSVGRARGGAAAGRRGDHTTVKSRC